MNLPHIKPRAVTRVVVLVTLLLWLSPGVGRAETFEVRVREAAVKFHSSLDADQQESIIRPFDAAERTRIQFTGGRRPGVRIGTLTATQRGALDELLGLVLSEYGLEMANKVAEQDGPDGLGLYYVTFFGDPAEDSNFAWRVAEHHLTLIQMVVTEDSLEEFGPILLGADPPELWLDEEKKLIGFWMSLIPTDRTALLKQGRGISGEWLAPDEGVPLSRLSGAARGGLEQVVTGRLRIYTPEVQQKIRVMLRERGGVQRLSLAFYGEVPDKPCREGGRWDFKLGGPRVLMDFENSRGHIHMCLWLQP